MAFIGIHLLQDICAFCSGTEWVVWSKRMHRHPEVAHLTLGLSRPCCASAAKDSRDGVNIWETTGLEKDVTSKAAELVKTESGGEAPF